MTGEQLVRMSGLGLVAGAALSFLAVLATTVLYSGDLNTAATQPGWVVFNLLEFVGVALLLLGLPVLAVASAGPAGRTGVAGIVLIFVTGLLFGVFLPLMSAVLAPDLATRAPAIFKGNGPASFGPLFIVGTLVS